MIKNTLNLIKINRPISHILHRKNYLKNIYVEWKNINAVGLNKNHNMHFIFDQMHNGVSSFFLPYVHKCDATINFEDNTSRQYTDHDFNEFTEWLKSKNFVVEVHESNIRKCSKGLAMPTLNFPNNFVKCKDYNGTDPYLYENGVKVMQTVNGLTGPVIDRKKKKWQYGTNFHLDSFKCDLCHMLQRRYLVVTIKEDSEVVLEDDDK